MCLSSLRSRTKAAALLLVAGWTLGLTAAPDNLPSRILVFSKTAAFRHASIPDGLTAIKQLATENNLQVTATEDASVFNDASLAAYGAVVFLMTTGDVLDDTQQGAFERYIRAGHGYVGIHSASDTEYTWPWYGSLVGAYFKSHPAIQTATVRVEDFSHPSSSFLPAAWVREDEWYDFRTNPRAEVHVLATLEESTYTGGTMGDDHPIAWYHNYDGGRAWYTAGGHTSASYFDPHFRAHLLGGIRYAAGKFAAPPPGAFVLFDGRNTAQLVGSSGAGPIPWPSADGVITVVPGSGSIHTFQAFTDFLLHAEFRVPPTPAGTPEGSLNNSGVFLQEQFEIQILEAYNRPVSGANDCGAIWSIRDPSTNASLPAGTWETFDISFRAARWTGTTKTENARVTVLWNGVLVHDNIEIPRPTPDGAPPETPPPGTIGLQDLVGPVQFRNLWVSPLDTPAPPAPTNLTAVARAAQVTLAWATNSGRTSYNIKRAPATGSAAGVYTLLADGWPAASYIDAAVANGVAYSYVVSAVAGGVESPDSQPASVLIRGSSPVPVTFIARGASWKYLDDGSSPSVSWRTTNFNDSAWRVGPAQLGYGDGDEATLIRSNRTDNSRIITTYFRKTFLVTNVWAITNLAVSLLRDDGGVVYLNNAEIFRSNLTNGSISSATPALVAVGGSDESLYFATNVARALLVNGTNLVAVEIHQSSTTSSDVSFDLALTAQAFGAPELSVAGLDPALRLAWPLLPDGFGLESSVSLGPDQVWLRLTNVPVTIFDNQNVVTLDPPAPGSFYRLARPSPR